MPKLRTAIANPVHQITEAILILRGHRILLDSQLAALYGVSTKRLNDAFCYRFEAEH